jgi:hypothetical protein
MAVTNYYSVNGRIIAESTNGVRTDYHRDALGSVVATTDQNQSVTATARYAAYGTPFSTTGSYNTLRFGWCGSWGYRKTQRSGTGLAQAEEYVRARHLSISAARWTTAGPAGGSSDAYRHRPNKQAAPADLSDELIVVTLPGSPMQAGCGGEPAIWWDFVLKHPAPCDGYFVQQVNVRCIIDQCENCQNRGSRKEDSFAYWEAFFVYENHTTTPGRQPPNPADQWTDQYWWHVGTKTSGVYAQVGIVKFFCRKDTDVGEWLDRKTYGKADVCPTGTRSQPTTGKEPDWFVKDTKLIAGPATRIGLTSWSCCGDKNDYVDTQAYPPVSR